MTCEATSKESASPEGSIEAALCVTEEALETLRVPRLLENALRRETTACPSRNPKRSTREIDRRARKESASASLT